ncbi:MAG: EAL domain-containing protein [Thiotrichales bacterium]|nr:EAL domain-containing protein [Thiotrichales bacterium]
MRRNCTMSIQPATLLIVDDDSVTRLLLSKVLSSAGYPILSASNGREGLSLYMQQRPQLVLMDVTMPVMDGYAATRAIRQFETEHSVPILMLTALDDVESIDRAFEAGATDFITKPIHWHLLTQRIKYALRAAQIEEALWQRQTALDFVQTLAKLGYWEWDVLNDRITGSDATFVLFDVPFDSELNLEGFLSRVKFEDKPMIHRLLSELSKGQSQLQGSCRVTVHDGSTRYIEFLGQAEFDHQGALRKISGSVQDLSRLHQAESLIAYQNHHDALTGLPNRNHALETLSRHLQQNSQSLCAVLVLDIDRFKQLNHHHGQSYGDRLLQALAQRLKHLLREGDYVARLSSDEFCLVIRNLQALDELTSLLKRLQTHLQQPFILEQQEHFLSFSIGISLAPQDGTQAEALINQAHLAREHAKQQGGNQTWYFSTQMNQGNSQNLILENALRTALKKAQMEVYYQPQVDAQTLKPCGAEALIRWHHPELGQIPPSLFIPLAETIGLIGDLGQQVMQHAVEQANRWYLAGFPLRIGINLSGRQFNQNNLMQDLQMVLANTELPAKLVDLEITESLAMSDPSRTKQQLKSLKALGASISIDDFGTGYSSLAYLQSFPIDTLKIDRSFVINLQTSAGQTIVSTIIAMAHALGLEVIAEGIETQAQQDFLQAKGCHIFQGYKFGKPMPAEAFFAWLTEREAPNVTSPQRIAQ